MRDVSWEDHESDAEGDTGGDTDGNTPWPRRLSPRRRLLGAATAAAVVVVALLVVLSGVPGGGDGLWQTLRPPTATLAPGEDTVVFVHMAPWGALTLDGRHVDAALSNTQGGGYIDITLARGEHQLGYVAPPFPALHCRVSVPRAATDTCPLADRVLAFQFQGVSARRVLDLQATPSHLPPDQYQALAHRVQQALVFAPGDVLPGDHYLQQDGTVIAAAVRLWATLVVSLNTDDSNHFDINGEPCITLCPGSFGFATPGGRPSDWDIIANVRAEWQIVDADGHVVSTAPNAQSGPMLMVVQARWDGAWSVTPGGPLGVQQQAFSRLCEPAISQIFALVLQGQNNQGYGISTQTGREPADGCLLTAQQLLGTPNPPGTPVSSGTTATFLYRYGALIAADDNAHRRVPQLPLPSANERSIIAGFAAGQRAASQQRRL